MIDTGGAYFVCSPEVATGLGFVDRGDNDFDGLSIRGTLYKGQLLRVEMALEPDEGEGAVFEVTAFVPRYYAYSGVSPEVDQEEGWMPVQENTFPPIPNFLGLYGCLERIRFAIDLTQPDGEFYFKTND